jgi:hypothetical protein
MDGRPQCVVLLHVWLNEKGWLTVLFKNCVAEVSELWRSGAGCGLAGHSCRTQTVFIQWVAQPIKPNMKTLLWIAGLVTFQIVLHSLVSRLEDPNYDVFLVIAHHKSGTSLAGKPGCSCAASRRSGRLARNWADKCEDSDQPSPSHGCTGLQ